MASRDYAHLRARRVQVVVHKWHDSRNYGITPPDEVFTSTEWRTPEDELVTDILAIGVLEARLAAQVAGGPNGTS